MPKLQFYKPPDIETGYMLNPEKSYFSLVVPETSTNLVYNPEVATLNFFSAAGAASISLNTDLQMFGQNSLQSLIDFNAYVYHTLQTTLVPNNKYTFSVYVRGNGGKFRLEIIDGTLNTLVASSSLFTPTSERWTRYQLTFNSNLIPTVNQIRLAIRKIDIGTKVMLSDGWQLEQKSYSTTFISGSLEGNVPGEVPRPYYWVATPHQSPSIRREQTRDGGRLVSLEELGFQVTGFNGFGLPSFDLVATPIASGIGSVYQGASITERELEICGVLMSCDIKNFLCNRGKLSHFLSPSYVDKAQPIKLVYQVFDCETPICNCLEALVLYQSGLEGEIESVIGEELCISFKMFDPLFKECGNRSVQLNLYKEDAGTMGPIGKDINGEWQSMNNNYGPLFGDGVLTGLGSVYELTIGPDNNLYLGAHAEAGDDPSIIGNSVGRWTGESWELIGRTYLYTGPGTYVRGGGVRTIEKGPDGKLYVGGYFDAIGEPGILPPSARVELGLGGTNTTDGLNFARYDIVNNVWEYIGRFRNGDGLPPGNDTWVYDIQLLLDGKMAVVGQFSDPQSAGAAGILPAPNVRNAVMYDPITNTFEHLAPLANNTFGAVNDEIFTVAQSPNGNIWIGGNFSFASELPPNVIAENVAVFGLYPSGGFDTPGGGLDFGNLVGGSVFKIVIGLDGTVYAGGEFVGDQGYVDLHPLPAPGFPANIPINTTTAGNTQNAAFSFVEWKGTGSPRGWVSLGILGANATNNTFGLKGPATISDMVIDRDGKIHIVGQIDYAYVTAFPDTSFLAVPPAYVLPPYSPIPQHILEEALNTQIPNANGYVIWDGTQFIIPHYLVNQFGISPPGLSYQYYAIEVGDVYGANYSTDTLFPTIPNFSYQLPGTGGLQINPGYQGSVFVGPASGYEIRSGDIVFINLECNDYSKPIFNINGPGILKRIINTTTGATIFINDYELAVNETITLDLTQPILKFVSNLKGNLRGELMPNSNLNSFVLQNGSTGLLVEMDLSTIVDGLSNAFMKWRQQYWDAGLACNCCDPDKFNICDTITQTRICPNNLDNLTFSNPDNNCNLSGSAAPNDYTMGWLQQNVSRIQFTYNSLSMPTNPHLGINFFETNIIINDGNDFGITGTMGSPQTGTFVYVAGLVTYTLTVTGGGIFIWFGTKMGITDGTTVTLTANRTFSTFNVAFEDVIGNNPNFTLTNLEIDTYSCGVI